MATEYYKQRCKDEHRRPMSTLEENEIVARAAQGNRKAKDIIAYRYMYFVKGIAGCYKRSDLSYEDLVSAGCIGLMRAIESYSSAAGVQFISYASWWVKAFIVVEIDKAGSLIRLPSNQGRALRKALRTATNPEDLSDEAKILKGLSQGSASIHEHTGGSGGDSGYELLSILPDTSAEDPSDMASEEVQKFIHTAVGKLPERERTILSRYFGLFNKSTSTLREIGLEDGRSSNRIREVRNRGMRMIRNFCMGKNGTLTQEAADVLEAIR